MSWIRNLRVAKGKTLKTVAEMAGISESYLSQVEQGKRAPSVKVAKAIADALGVDWTRFFEQEGADEKVLEVLEDEEE